MFSVQRPPKTRTVKDLQGYYNRRGTLVKMGDRVIIEEVDKHMINSNRDNEYIVSTLTGLHRYALVNLTTGNLYYLPSQAKCKSYGPISVPLEVLLGEVIESYPKEYNYMEGKKKRRFKVTSKVSGILKVYVIPGVFSL